jgi:hypothetical protein
MSRFALRTEIEDGHHLRPDMPAEGLRPKGGTLFEEVGFISPIPQTQPFEAFLDWRTAFCTEPAEIVGA